MFVTFYDDEKAKQIDFMVEMKTVPCIGDMVMIDKKTYKVVGRMFATKKPNRCCCYVVRHNRDKERFL